MERPWDPGAAQKGTQPHRGKQAGRWMQGESPSTIHHAPFPSPQAGGGISIGYAGARCPCNYVLCDLRQNWKCNVLNSNTTGHAKLHDNADLCSLFRGAFILRIRGGRWDFCRAVKKGLQTCRHEPFFDLYQGPLEMSPWSLSSIIPLRLWR